MKVYWPSIQQVSAVTAPPYRVSWVRHANIMSSSTVGEMGTWCGDWRMEDTRMVVRERNMVTSSPIRPGTTCNLW